MIKALLIIINFNVGSVTALDQKSIAVEEPQLKPGPRATLIHINSNQNPFTFLLRDVNADFPVYIPEFSVVVTEINDQRSFQEIESDILVKNLKTKYQQYESEPEETYENAAIHTRDQPVPTWLGLSRRLLKKYISRK